MAGTSNRTVLVVDHNDSFRDFLVSTLVGKGCAVDQASDCENGIRKASTQHFDVVFMDCFMPTCGGDEATRAIIREDPSTRVVIVSESPTCDRVERAIEYGACQVLSKPIDAQELTRYLDSMFESL